MSKKMFIFTFKKYFNSIELSSFVNINDQLKNYEILSKLIKFDFREHDFKKLYKSFKRNYKKANFNYDQWRKANGKRFISSFNKLNKTPECIEYFRGKNS